MNALPARFWAKVDMTGPNDCWIWIAGRDRYGYGRFTHLGQTRPAYRIAYLNLVGQIPDGLEIDHLCHTRDPQCRGGRSCLHRRCVNPAHLEPVTPRENALRGVSFSAVNAAKTHCEHGHEFDEANTYFRPKNPGQRTCRACVRAASRRYSARQLARSAA